jgi:[ribosomal protein S5]-alanine N-acetyltransferase
VTGPRLETARLELRPLPAGAAAALPLDREDAARLLGAKLPADWPQLDLVDLLPAQAALGLRDEPFGIWVLVERETGEVVGDTGFLGRPDADGLVEIGYSVVPAARRRGFATEAAGALVTWALGQPGVRAVLAACDQDNVPSVRTLERLGFTCTREKEGKVHWRLDRSTPGQAANRRRQGTSGSPLRKRRSAPRGRP